MKCYMTDDGYKFYRQLDGKLTDNPDPDASDQTYNSLADLQAVIGVVQLPDVDVPVDDPNPEIYLGAIANAINNHRDRGDLTASLWYTGGGIYAVQVTFANTPNRELCFGDQGEEWGADVAVNEEHVDEIWTTLSTSVKDPAAVADAFYAALKVQQSKWTDQDLKHRTAAAAHLYDRIVAALETLPLQSIGVAKVWAEIHACPFVHFEMADGRIVVAGDVNETWDADVYPSEEAFGEGDEHLHTDLSTDGEQNPVTVAYALFQMIQTAPPTAKHESEN